MSGIRHRKTLTDEGGTSNMTSTYLRRQAEALLNLSRATIDLAVAGRLRALAAEFRAKALELEQNRIAGELAQAKHSPQH
jgi:hypothetical protein